MENLSRPQQTCLVFIYYFGQFNQNVPKHILRDFMDNIRFSSLSPVKTTYYIVLLTLNSMLMLLHKTNIPDKLPSNHIFTTF